MKTLNAYFGSADVKDFHSTQIANRAAGRRGAEVAELLGDGRSIGIQLEDEHGWTFKVQEGQVIVEEGTENASLLISTDAAAWSDLITEAWSIMGLAIQGRITIERGGFNHLAKWEPALQGLYNDRPIWSPSKEVTGDSYAFSMHDKFSDMKSVLNRLGFLLLRESFWMKKLKR